MEVQLKQRLVGAAVLTVLAVIFVPMLLRSGSEPEPVGIIRGDDPPAGGSGFESSVVPLDVGSQASASEPVPAVAAPAPRPQPEPEPAAEPEPPAPDPAPRAAASGWVIQLGSFASRPNAQALVERLAGMGLSARAETDETGTRPITRVFVGPWSDRDEANRVADRLERETRLRGLVIRTSRRS